jgi:three-Cys-motif partner protein
MPAKDNYFNDFDSEHSEYEVIGPWSEVKLEIIREYASSYSKIMTARDEFHHVYIDAFSGAGMHKSKATGDLVLGSPLNALNLEQPFKEYYFIDIQGNKINSLKKEVGKKEGVHFFTGDCNDILLESIFPNVKYEDWRRGLCLLDPYGLHLDWNVIETAGKMKSIEIFLNFPIADINRNALQRNREKVSPKQIDRMTRYWGDESWRESLYQPEKTLFEDWLRKSDNEKVARIFQERLKNIAGFKYVPDPMPMHNSKNAIVYYLFFASSNDKGRKIVEDIFKKYAGRN